MSEIRGDIQEQNTKKDEQKLSIEQSMDTIKKPEVREETQNNFDREKSEVQKPTIEEKLQLKEQNIKQQEVIGYASQFEGLND